MKNVLLISIFSLSVFSVHAAQPVPPKPSYDEIAKLAQIAFTEQSYLDTESESDFKRKGFSMIGKMSIQPARQNVMIKLKRMIARIESNDIFSEEEMKVKFTIQTPTGYLYPASCIGHIRLALPLEKGTFQDPWLKLSVGFCQVKSNLKDRNIPVLIQTNASILFRPGTPVDNWSADPDNEPLAIDHE